MSKPENRVDLPVLRNNRISLGLDVNAVESLSLGKRVKLSQVANVGLLEEKVLDVGKPVLELVQNRRNSVEVDVVELDVVYFARLRQVPLTVDEPQGSLAVDVEALADYLHQVVASLNFLYISENLPNVQGEIF